MLRAQRSGPLEGRQRRYPCCYCKQYQAGACHCCSFQRLLRSSMDAFAAVASAVHQRRRSARSGGGWQLPIQAVMQTKARAPADLRPAAERVVYDTAPSDGLPRLGDWCSPAIWQRLLTCSFVLPAKTRSLLQPTCVRIDHSTHSSPTYIKWRNSWSLRFARAPCCSSLQDALA